MAVLCPGWALVVLGTLSVASGVVAFFPGLSLQLQAYVAWSCRVACPVWAGLLAVCAGAVTVRSGLRKRTRSLAEASCALCVLSAAASVPHLSLALSSLLMGPLCRYSHAGVAGTAYLGQAVRWPYPYALWQETRTFCVEPLGAEWQHLALQVLDVALSSSELALAITAGVSQGRRLVASRVPQPLQSLSV
uniref:Transmembrane protein 212 n=1 Tax=Petromyzon marinus TaxID=7757 RepID=A0AAJ7UDK4_PETMA|nr:transmembrane protein 212 [Petromyzon marinus]